MRLVETATLDAGQLDAVRTIYLDAFGPATRSPFEEILADRVLVLLVEARPLGLAVLRDLGDTGWTFLRYFAVADRGRGVGPQLWRLLRAANVDRDRIVLDVDDPDEPDIDEAERSIRTRRIGFYRRLGVDLPPVGAYAPPHHGVPVPMRLMVADVRLDQTPPVVGADLRAVLIAVLRHRYELAETSPEVRHTLDRSGLAS